MTSLPAERGGLRLTLMTALRQCAIHGPLQHIDALLQASIGHARSARPFRHWQRFAEMRNQVRITSITGLLSSRGPAAIAFGIGTAVIDAIKRMRLSRFWPHVGVELREIMAPLRRHRDPAAPIEGIRAGARIATAFHDAGPTSILRALPIFERAGGMAVGRHSLPGVLIFIAAARFDVAVHQRRRPGDVVVPAGAAAQEQSISTALQSDFMDYRQSDEGIAGFDVEGNGSSHEAQYTPCVTAVNRKAA